MNLKGEGRTIGDPRTIGGGLTFSSGAVGFGARKDGIAQADALLFHPVEEAPSPDEFRGQDAQGEHNRNPTGARSNDHKDAQSKQSEPEENLQEALRLL